MIFIKQTERRTRPLFVGRYNVLLRRLMLHHHTLPSKRERIAPGERAGWGTGIEQEKADEASTGRSPDGECPHRAVPPVA
jgi:hypothetical protein